MIQMLYEALYQACLKAARGLGDDIRKISWHHRFHVYKIEHENKNESIEEKAA